jgi:histidinol-phosphate aminotransferase
MALEAALAALADEAHVQATRSLVVKGLKQLEEGVRALGLRSVPSVANFILVEVGNGREVFDALRRKKVIVRPMDGYGMPGHVRVTVGTEAENSRFLAALAAVRQGRT